MTTYILARLLHGKLQSIQPSDLPERLRYGQIAMSAQAAAQHTMDVLPSVTKLMTRIIPNVPVYIVPRVMNTDASTQSLWSEWGGMAFFNEQNPAGPFIAMPLNADVQPWKFIDTALHEAFHVVDNTYLTAEDRAIVYGSVERGIPLPMGYYDSAIERVARAFTAFALYQLSISRYPMMPDFHGPRTSEHIFWEVLTGNYGKPKDKNILQLYVEDFMWLATMPFRLLRRLTTTRKNGRTS